MNNTDIPYCNAEHYSYVNTAGKSIPLQPWTVPELIYGSTEAENGHFLIM